MHGALRSGQRDAHPNRADIAVEELDAGGRQMVRSEKARVALARKLGVILHRMWIDGQATAGPMRPLPWGEKERLV